MLRASGTFCAVADPTAIPVALIQALRDRWFQMTHAEGRSRFPGGAIEPKRPPAQVSPGGGLSRPRPASGGVGQQSSGAEP